jgi:hypothetical protein
MCRPYFHDNVIDLAFPSSLSLSLFELHILFLPLSFVFPFLSPSLFVPLATAGSGCRQCVDERNHLPHLSLRDIRTPMYSIQHETPL